jgi:hypothetical protein
VAATNKSESIGCWDIITNVEHHISIKQDIMTNLTHWLLSAATVPEHPDG